MFAPRLYTFVFDGPSSHFFHLSTAFRNKLAVFVPWEGKIHDSFVCPPDNNMFKFTFDNDAHTKT